MEKTETGATIRDVRAADVEPLLAMIRALAAHHGEQAEISYKNLWRDLFGARPWLEVLIAERQGLPVGYGALCPRAQLQFGRRGMELHHLYVAGTARGLGVGRALVRAAEARARARGCAFLVVGTDPGNHAAQRFYQGLGMQAVPGRGPGFVTRLAPGVAT